MEVICFPVYSGGSFKGSIGADIFKLACSGRSIQIKKNWEIGGKFNGGIGE
jgi:hypothetical protein